ncbi:MAG: domain S-box protein [Pedosphaera sp.]|nr:domain S-box protein [Pedosphaera sp.]
MKRDFSFARVLIILAAVYFCAGKLGLLLAFVHANATAVWPPTGIALVAVLIWGYRVWPAIFAAAFLVNITTEGSVLTSLGIACGNTLEAVAGAWLVGRYAGGREAFERPQTIFKYLVLAAMGSTLISATAGVTTLCLGGYAQWANYGTVWQTWWVGDMVSDLVFAPVLLIWSARPHPRWKISAFPEMLILAGTIFLVAEAIFGDWFAPKGRFYPVAYLAMPPLLWAAWRYGRRGASAALLLMSAIAILGTTRGFGPFVMAERNHGLFFLQIFIATTALTALVMASLVWERNRSEALTSGIVHAALDCIVTMNQEGRIVEFNPAAEMTFGYRRNEVIGRLMAEVIIPPALREAHARGLARYLATGKGPVLGKRIELTGLRSDGTEFPVELSIIRIQQEGAPLFAGFIRDITERKQAEAAVRQSAERLRFMADSMPQKIFTTKPNGEVDYLNKQWSVFTGFDFEQMRDWGWTKFVHPEDVEENVRRWKHSVETGEAFQMEHRFRRADGVFRWHLSRAQALRDDEGKVLMWIGSNTDIDDQKRAEHHLEDLVAERTAKLRETIGELESFSYSISHDLRAPLRSMTGFVRLVQEDCGDKIGPVGVGYLNRISLAAGRMDQLIRDVLTLSHVARTELKLQPTNVETLLRGMLETYPNLLPPHAEIRLDGELPPVLANEAALVQCISNLLGNAVKFVPPGVMPRVRIWAEHRDDRVRLWFEDNGIGIAKRHQDKIFGIFQRLSSEYEGTGIGLAIVRKAVERMGGAVGLESEPGKGSRFWLELLRAK